MHANFITAEELKNFKEELLENIQELLDDKIPKQRNWMRSTDVMEHLKISHSTLQGLRKNKIVPSYKVEGIYYYDRTEIDQCIEECKLRGK